MNYPASDSTGSKLYRPSRMRQEDTSSTLGTRLYILSARMLCNVSGMALSSRYPAEGQIGTWATDSLDALVRNDVVLPPVTRTLRLGTLALKCIDRWDHL